MCGLKDTQIYDLPLRVAKDHVQPLATLDSLLLNGKKILISHNLSPMDPRASGKTGMRF